MTLGNRSWDSWIAEYSAGHQNPANRFCHTIGIPTIALSFLLTPLLFLNLGFWKLCVGLFAAGWTFQFIGHAFEGKPPEFFKDWRFLLVGARWWLAKWSGRA